MFDNNYIIKKLLNEIENTLNARGGRGHGHPYSNAGYGKRVYGKSIIDYKYEDDEYDEELEPDETDNVKVSKVFLKKREET